LSARVLCQFAQAGGEAVLWALIALLLILWLAGLALDLVGGLVHILLVVALIVLIVQFVQGRRAV
jgi:hypothetical protein